MLFRSATEVHACKINPVPACEVLKPPSATMAILSASSSSLASDSGSTIRLPTNPLPAPSNVDFRGDEPRPTSMSIRLLHRRRLQTADRLHWIAGLALGGSPSPADLLGSRPQPSGCGWGYPSSVAPAAGPQPLTPHPGADPHGSWTLPIVLGGRCRARVCVLWLGHTRKHRRDLLHLDGL